MIKALIMAASRIQFINFCRNLELNPNEYRLVRHDGDCTGWWIDKPVILLEGYQYNRDYRLGLLQYIGHRFENISFVSEAEIYESVKF